MGDPDSRRWVERLRDGHPEHPEAVAALHALLLTAAGGELRRRRSQLGNVSGPELDDLAHQCADDAVVKVLRGLDDFRGLSRFTTWAFKFAIFEVSSKIARHAWHRQAPSAHEPAFEDIADASPSEPPERVERREQLAALRDAIRDGLTERQREVFVAVALNEEPIDVVALRLGSNRNAIYKNLFDARRRLREHLAAAGHALAAEEGR